MEGNESQMKNVQKCTICKFFWVLVKVCSNLHTLTKQHEHMLNRFRWLNVYVEIRLHLHVDI